MLRLLRRLLGWDDDNGFDFEAWEKPSDPPPKIRTEQPRKPRQPAKRPPPSAETKAPENPDKNKGQRSPADILNNPDLKVEQPQEAGFDPYNTGAFDRSSSWEKISKRHDR
jgi:hypothetical protein